ncbi:hypothetical protein [Aquimarina megaterium]|uniref:hypothetical protein n=1 Tax=Aquimarina megaterium TaxID=1443666 RepID=UPI0011121C49|nr:hypothetical protein [Aquimarina megaterium]
MRIILLYLGFCFLLFFSCNSINQEKYNQIRITYIKKNLVNDTIYLDSKQSINSIAKIIESSESEMSKFPVNVWLELISDTETKRIGINKKRFKTEEGQFLCNTDLEKLVKRILEDKKNDNIQ